MNSSASAALGRIPSGLFVITAGEGPATLATLVSLVQQVSLEPPCIALAVQPERAIARRLVSGERFGLNILHAGDRGLLRRFAKASAAGTEALADVPHRVTPAGAALLDACAFLECTVTRTLDPGGDHVLVIARVDSGDLLGDPAAKPMVHVRHNGLRY